jgi:hypothetical protein
MYSIWGKKSKEAEAEKKKPRTSAAQIRVQKGKLFIKFKTKVGRKTKL